MTEPEYVAETLAWCNARREEQGKRALKKLPKGKRGDSRSCPCGTATGLAVLYTKFSSGDSEDSEYLPDSVQRFVKAFDAGRLPQYEAKP